MKNYPNLNKLMSLTVIVILVIGLFSLAVSPVHADGDDPNTDDPVVDPPAPATYTIVLNGMGAKVSLPSIDVTEGEAYGELPVPQRQYYNFKGWFTAPTGGSEITATDVVTADTVPTTLYARWEGYAYYITYDPARAVLSQTKYLVHYGDTLGPMPIPYRSGLVFMGWYTDKVGGTMINSYTQMSITKNISLYAKWAPIWYLQIDKRWSRVWYRIKKEKSTIGNAGCGPSSMAMVVASIKSNNVTPVSACSWSRSHNYKAYMSGTKDEFFKAYGKKYGIKVQSVGTYDLRKTKKSVAKKYHNTANKAVQSGNWVIALVGKGNWTTGSGHFILWYKDEGNYALIRDPNSTSAAKAKAKISTLQKQVKRYWIITVPASKQVS